MVTDSNNQFAPPKSAVADRTPTSDVTAQDASRNARLGAAILDGIIFSAPFAPAYFLAAREIGIRWRLAGGNLKGLDVFKILVATGPSFWGGMLVAVLVWTITAVLVHRHGQTIGKRIVGIKVVRRDGSRAGLARIFWLRNVVNNLLGWIPVVGGLYALVDLLWIFGSPRRCLHDYIADTIVVSA